ncbi:MBL fold metallo-hydrolase [Dactylosporangium sp. NPDC000555]|uniref:MBL fold metallo-hydrolase n=1 Tax=Dactylosporangium sp. NPDC000555 TaxID=3154260 RepID=UPI00331F0FB1
MSTAPELPPVEQVLPGIWALPLPLTGTGLAYVTVYAIEADDGFYLVDAGWSSPNALDLLAAGLAAAGASLADLRGVLVTHIHPDHYGLAARIRAATTAWIALHPAEAALIDVRYSTESKLGASIQQWLHAAGVPHSRSDELGASMHAGSGDVGVCHPDLELRHGDRPPIPGREVVAVHTPGHTPGHLMFDLPAEHAVFAGDHLLSRATPNISFGPLSGPDPLSDYLRSLLAVADLGPRTAFPAHQHAIPDAASRAGELVRHHDDRLQEVLMVLRSGAETVHEVCGELAWHRRLESLPAYLVRAALGETHAHLLRLATLGAATVSPGPPQRWAAVSTRGTE